ncbi:hypothetical protein HARCEL1_03670 [Halococcoides cellulosivorans]|uniref:Uncharacterized protein n=1 Tax=Halococcoides cellulosivorans TaxID=1679096 RepID=A0A2R4WZB2_9EURY|nr:hypothetical protein HARCEL1_03670 [Halococcoides cellulosivorans]
MLGRLAAVLTVEALSPRSGRTLAARFIFGSCLAQRHRWDQPHRVVGIVEDLTEARLIVDPVSRLVVELRRGLLIALFVVSSVPSCSIASDCEVSLAHL